MLTLLLLAAFALWVAAMFIAFDIPFPGFIPAMWER
jgi:hypothetical protein